MLQLPQSASSATLRDLAVTSTSVAVVGADHSVTIFSVPSTWDRDDPPCEVLAHLPPGNVSELGGKDGLGLVSKVEWLRKDGREWLAIGGGAGVGIIRPEDLKGQQGLNLMTLARDSKVLKTEGVSSLTCGVC
jgi:hypothetical protein